MYNQGLIFKEVAFFINSIKNFIFIGMDTQKKLDKEIFFTSLLSTSYKSKTFSAKTKD